MAAKFPRRDQPPRRRDGSRPPEHRDQPRRGRDDAARPPAGDAAPAAPTAWEAQAAWYDGRQGERGDDLYSGVVLPAVLRPLAAKPGQRVLDVCCGQGVLGRVLAETGVRVLGVDASPALIEAARARAGGLERYEVGDARELAAAIGDERGDHAA